MITASRPSRRSALSSVQLPPRVQPIEVQQRVEHQEVAAFRLAAPDRVVRKRDDVPFVERHVDDRRVLRDFAAVFDKARYEQVARIRVAEDDAQLELALKELYLGTEDY